MLKKEPVLTFAAAVVTFLVAIGVLTNADPYLVFTEALVTFVTSFAPRALVTPVRKSND